MYFFLCTITIFCECVAVARERGTARGEGRNDRKQVFVSRANLRILC